VTIQRLIDLADRDTQRSNDVVQQSLTRRFKVSSLLIYASKTGVAVSMRATFIIYDPSAF